MTLIPGTPDPLEQAIHRTLRQLPERMAPAALEQRVLAEIARRAALPWWRKSFAHWPPAVRVGFFFVCAAVVPLALVASSWVSAGLDPAVWRPLLPQPAAWLHATASVMQALSTAFEIFSRAIPSLWLYGALAFFAALYAAVFGLGAAAYKAVQAHA